MKQKTGRKLLSFLLTLAMVMGLVPGMSMTAFADQSPIIYLNASGETATCESYNEVTKSNKTLTSGWNVVTESVTISESKTVNGALNIILCDGATLTIAVSSSYAVSSSDNFTIYAQSTGNNMGELVASSPNNSALQSLSGLTINGGKISVNSMYSGIYASGSLTINGGKISVNSNSSSGIVAKGSLTINGGIVTASGSTSAISGNVANSIPGIGWTNTEGTEGETVIDASNEAKSIDSYKRVMFRAVELYPLSVGGIQVTSGNASNIAGNNTASYDATTKTLTLNSFTHYDDDTYGIYNNGIDGLTVIIENTNTIENGYGGIYSSDSLNIKGSGTLNIKSTNNNTAIYSESDLTISESVNITAEAAGFAGIYVDKLTLESTGEINVKGSTWGLYTNGEIKITNGDVTAEGGASGIGEKGGGAPLVIGTNAKLIAIGGNYGAIYHGSSDYRKVQNDIAGVAWTNKEGTEGRLPIAVSTEGQPISYLYHKVEFPVSHTHSFTYSASGATITATCSNTDENCTLDDGTAQHNHTATLTIAAAGGAYDGTTAFSATVTNNIPAVGGDMVGNIEYYKVNTEGATTGGTVQVSAPVNAGYYYANVTLTSESNSYTAVKAFTIAKGTAEALDENTARTNSGINYQTEQATPSSGYQISTDNANPVASTPVSLTDILDGNTPTLYVRRTENDNQNAGDWVAVTLTARPDAPAAPETENATNDSTADGKIKDALATWEYKNKEIGKEPTNWTPMTAGAVTVKSGTYQIRVKATDSAPHGKVTEVTVGSNYVALTEANKPTISVSDSHNPPVVGDTLTASTTATDIVYEWYRDEVKITSAIASTYTLTADDVGKAITVKVKQTKQADGKDYADDKKPTQTSDAIGPIKKNLADENVTVTFTSADPTNPRPTFTVSYGTPAQTVSADDYTVTYSEPTDNPRVVTVTITPKAGTNYAGTITKKYTLAPEAKFVFNAGFVNFTSETFAGTFTKDGVTYEISEKSDFSEPVSGGENLLKSNESSKIYYIRVAEKTDGDAYPASGATQFTITRPNKPATGIFAVTDTSPSGTNDGGIRLTDTSLAARLEYNIGSEWRDFPSSGVISGLGNGTYFVRYKHDATQGYLSSEAQSLTIVTETIALTGVSIKGAAKYGETLTAVLTGAGGKAPTGVTLKWQRDGSTDVGSDSTYTLQAEDIGHTITLIALQSNGEVVKSSFTGIVAKKDGSKTKPTVTASGISKTDTTITVNSPVSGGGKTYEYSKDGGTSWQDSNKFEGLTAETPYFIVVREKAPDEYTNPGASSAPLSVRTDKASVALTAVTLKNLSASDGTTTTVTCGQTLQAVITPSDATGVTYKWYRGEMQIDGATGSTYTLTGTDSGSKIKVVVTATSGSVAPQTTSGTVTKATSPKPSLSENANITKTSSTITVNGFKNNTTKGVKYEYSCDNGATWQVSNTFTGLTANTNYQIVVRIAETAERSAATSDAITVGTSEKPLPFNEGSETPKAIVTNYPYGTTTGYPTPSLTVVPTNNATPVYYWSAKSSGSDKTAWTSSKPTSVGTYYLWAEIPADNTYAGYTTIRTAFKVEKADVTEQHIESVSVDTDTLTATITGTIPAGTTLEYALVPSGSSLDGAAWNTVTPPTFKIDRELDTTVYTVYIREKETATTNASRPVASASFTPTKYTVTYNANGGTGDVPATEAYTGTGHAISQTWTGLTRTGYSFGGWSDTETGTTQTTSVSGAATLYAIWTPNTYTVKFDAKDGSAVNEVSNVKYGEEFILPTTTKASSAFAGWSKSSAATTADYTAGQLVKNLAGKDKTADEITLYAVWTAVASVSGTVSSNEGENVTLKLMRGDTQIGDTQAVALDPTGSGYSGTFRFDGVPYGIYNLIIEQVVPDGNGGTETLTKSIMVTVSGDVTIDSSKLKMPTSARSALQVVGTDTPPAVVDGLDKLAESEAVDERSVTVTMTVEKQEEQTVSQTATEEEKATQEAIEQLKSSADTDSGSNGEVKEMDFLNINVTKEVTLNGAVESTEAIADTGAANIMEIVFPYVKPGSGRIDLWRFHGTAQKFNEKSSGSGSYEDLDFYFLNGMIHLFTRYFSTYAVSYTETTSGGGSGGSSSSGTTYAPTISNHSNGTVSINPTSPKAGNTVTITAKPNEGYEVDTVTVTDASGKTVSVTKVNDTTYTFTQPSSKVKIDVTFKAASTTDALAAFRDVSASDWYADAVRWAVDNGVMNGVGDNRFDPNGDTSRAMVVTMLWRMEGSPAYVGMSEFTDVDNEQWYGQAIRWASAEGIVKGYANPTGAGTVYNPNGAVTREQLAAILYRYAQYKKANVSASADLGSFNDAATVSGWATSAMQWAVGSGIINGIDGNLVPAGNATRAQVATMLMRYSTAK